MSDRKTSTAEQAEQIVNGHVGAPRPRAVLAAVPDLTGEAPSPSRLPTLPPDLWERRKVLGHIRTAARARLRSADVALYGVLARLASMLPPGLRADAGLGPAQLCTFVAVVGPSGVGKSTGYRVAAELLPVPAHLAGEDEDGNATYVDGIGIGSGEGITELYMGRRQVGEKWVRTQVRHRALVVVDEGETLTAIGQRRGTTTGQTLRSAWSGVQLGSAGATEQTRRMVPAGSYTLGMVIGYQMGTAQVLIGDTDTGMAQRYLWCAATDPTIDENDVPAWPGPLPLKWPAPIRNNKATTTISYPDTVQAKLRARHAAVQRGDIVPDPADTHAPLHRVRLAALLALLDGRTAVNDEDWQLGGTIWSTSCAVRAEVAEHGRRDAERDRAERDDARVTLAERTAAVVDVAPARVERIAHRLAERVREAGGMTRAAARRGVKYDERHLYDAALTVADVRGWVIVTESGALQPGDPL